jgi:hypothetical protein
VVCPAAFDLPFEFSVYIDTFMDQLGRINEYRRIYYGSSGYGSAFVYWKLCFYDFNDCQIGVWNYSNSYYFGCWFLILAESIGNSMWNLFLNPFDSPNRMNEIVWYNLIVKNRMFLLIGTTVFILNGLYNLQNREGFMQ